MNRRLKWSGLGPTVGFVLLGLLLLTPLRQLLEASMRHHMLVQFPALMLAGALIAKALPARLIKHLAGCNALGISGLTACALFLAVLMIPRVLDMALTDNRVEFIKFSALLFSGAVFWPSWRAAGLVIQGFFLGSVVPMTIVVATLYQDSPVRLCNAYGIEDQQQLGLGLLWIVGLAAFSWFVHAGRRIQLASRDSHSIEVGAAPHQITQPAVRRLGVAARQPDHFHRQRR